MAAQDLERQLEHSRNVQSGELAPFTNGGSVKSILPIEPLRHAGVDLDEPSGLPWHYIRDRGLLVIDLAEESPDTEAPSEEVDGRGP